MAIDESTETLIGMRRASRLSKRSISTIHRWRSRGLESKRNGLTFLLEWVQINSSNETSIQTSVEALNRFHRRYKSEREELTAEDMQHVTQTRGESYATR